MVLRGVLLCVLGGVAVVLAAVLLLPNQFSSIGDASQLALEVELAAVRDEILELRVLFQQVQADSKASDRASPSRLQDDGSERRGAVAPVDREAPLQNLERRIAELERAVAQVRSAQQSLGPMPDTLTGIVAALADKNLHGHDASPEQKQRRMELRRRLLELTPGDPQAPQVLLDLSTDYLVASGAASALGLLDEFTPRVALPTWDRLHTYANLHSQNGDYDRARSLYDTAVRDPSLTVAQRTSARFWHAYSLFQQHRFAEAASGFQSLVDEFGPAPPADVRNTIAGARNYLEQCRSQR